MRILILLLLTVHFQAVAVAKQHNTRIEAKAENEESQVNKKKIAEELDEQLRGFFTNDRPGLTALVVCNGEVLFEKAYGKASLELNVPMRPDHVGRIGSVTKPFTAVAILMLAQQGKLSLDDKITKFIDNYPDSASNVTLEHLLSHTSGIRNYNNNLSEFLARTVRLEYSQEQFMDLFKDEPSDFEPGTQYRYSNSGYYLLGLVIERVTGKSYRQHLHDEFFDPLGMKNTSVSGPHEIIPNRAAGYDTDGERFRNCNYESGSFHFSDGGILSTVHDLKLWYQALLDNKLLNAKNLNKVLNRYQLEDQSRGRTSYSWFPGNLLGAPFIAHDGRCSGSTCAVVCFPDEKLFIAVLSNCSWQGYQPPHRNFCLRAASIVLNKRYAAGNHIKNAEAYAGLYRSEFGESKFITARDGSLFLNRRQQIFHCEGEHFFVERTYETIVFTKDEMGDVITLISTNDSGVVFRPERR